MIADRNRCGAALRIGLTKGRSGPTTLVRSPAKAAVQLLWHAAVQKFFGLIRTTGAQPGCWQRLVSDVAVVTSSPKLRGRRLKRGRGQMESVSQCWV